MKIFIIALFLIFILFYILNKLGIKDKVYTLLKKNYNQKKYKRNKEKCQGLLSLIVKEEKEDGVILGRRNNMIFISFRNAALQEFFITWFTIMKMYKESNLSSDDYNEFIESKIIKAEENLNNNKDKS